MTRPTLRHLCSTGQLDIEALTGESSTNSWLNSFNSGKKKTAQKSRSWIQVDKNAQGFADAVKPSKRYDSAGIPID
jgi:hypothetical protein